MQLTDSHAHLSSKELLPSAPDLIARARASQVTKIVNICTDLETLEAGLALAKNYPEIYNAAATTPHDAETDQESFFSSVEKVAPSLVALGETGLDYHYTFSSKEKQQHSLVRYLDLSKTTGLPLIFHCREAFSDLFSLAAAHYPGSSSLLHCFTGSLQEAREALNLGWFLSFSGILTFKKAESLRETASFIPLDRILIETDAPYLAPATQRGKLNEPSFMVETLSTLAALLHRPIEEVGAATHKNAEQFFSFAKLKRNV